eukprot:5344282-Prymnesium_polylepis.2
MTSGVFARASSVRSEQDAPVKIVGMGSTKPRNRSGGARAALRARCPPHFFSGAHGAGGGRLPTVRQVRQGE